jgi:hypothetical protein
VIYADISHTSIAKEALERAGAGVDDSYEVRLEVTTAFDEKGKKLDPQYKVLEVIRFVEAGPPLRQGDMLEPKPPTPSGRRGGRLIRNPRVDHGRFFWPVADRRCLSTSPSQ